MAIAATVDLPTKINEGTTAFLSTQFVDQNGVPTNVESVSLTVDDTQTGTRLYGPIPATPYPTPNSTLQFILPPAANRIVGTGIQEKHVITLHFKYGGASQYTGTDFANYQVNNLQSITVDCPTPGVAEPVCTVKPYTTPTRTQTPTRTPTP